MKNFWKLSTLTLAAALGLVIATPSLRVQAQAEAQPAMKTALERLEAAEKNLLEATADKGGHRAKALKLTKQAIKETKAGIEYDNTH